MSMVMEAQEFDVAEIMGALYGDGIIGRKGVFERDWIRELPTRR